MNHAVSCVQSEAKTRLYVDNKSAICIASSSKDDRSINNNPAETIPETIKIFLSIRNILMRFYLIISYILYVI